MSPDGSNSDIARSRSHRNRNRKRWRKNRNRSSTPTSLLLDGDESHDDTDHGADGDNTNENDNGNGNDNGHHENYGSSGAYHHACHQNCKDGNRGASRPSPLPWTSDLHKAFAKAVLQIGIEESSPAVIAEQMITKNHYNTPDEEDEDANASPLNQENHKIHNSTDINLPEESRYTKQELTGERLKSHLQKMRKQKTRETEVFLEDHQRHLVRKRVLDREQKELKAAEAQRKEEARKRRTKRKRSQQKPSTLLDASAFDQLDERMVTTVLSDQHEEVQNNTNKNNDDVTKEEEERLLSMYLPLQSSAMNGSYRGRAREDLDFDLDSEHEFDESNSHLSAFPVGGRAIGMVTWAVQQEDVEEEKNRKQRRRQHAKQQQQQHQQQQKLDAGAWETASVDSWTSQTATAAGKLANTLGQKESETRDKIVIDCASSEDDDSEEEETEDQFKASMPTLTEAELNSPLGVSMRLAWDMIKHMHGVIAEERDSKLHEQLQLQHRLRQQHSNAKVRQHQQHLTSGGNSPVTIQTPSKRFSDGNDKLPPETERILPPNMNTGNPLLVAMAATGPPPANLVAALGGAVFGGLGTTATTPSPLPALLNGGSPVAFMLPSLVATTVLPGGNNIHSKTNAPCIVTPPSQSQIHMQMQTALGMTNPTTERGLELLGEQQTQAPQLYQQHHNVFQQQSQPEWQRNPSGNPTPNGYTPSPPPQMATTTSIADTAASLLKPLPPPRDLRIPVPSFPIPQFRSKSPLSTPMMLSDAMFNALLMQQQQPQQQSLQPQPQFQLQPPHQHQHQHSI